MSGLGSLTSIESVARQLDEARKSRLKETPVDFDAYLAAREEDIGRIKSTEQFRQEVIDEIFGEGSATGLTLPWPKTHDHFRVRHGEVTVWAGFNGHGKSMVTGLVALGLMHQGEKCCIASFEMPPRKTLKRLACQAISTRHPTESAVNRFLDQFSGRLYLYDQQGETTPDRILGVIYYCAEKLGITQFIVDSLMKVVGDEDDYNGQKRFIGKLCAAAKDLNIHIHLVHHSRKREDESRRPGKQDSKGSGAIVDQTDNYISVFKFPVKAPKPGEEPKNEATHGLFVDKCRHGEWEGMISLWFCEQSLQFCESERRTRLRYVND